MTRQPKTLIVGGGFSGMAAAIEMRKHGVDVELVEMDPGWRSYGAGISLGSATLRAFRQLGVLDAFLREGHAADGVNCFWAMANPSANCPRRAWQARMCRAAARSCGRCWRASSPTPPVPAVPGCAWAWVSRA
jgi:2-polyprenyl-6-methoxyphenol hydroxylase-like FAD-dependent oxidoreductase